MEEETVAVDSISPEEFATSVEDYLGVQSMIDDAKLFIHGIENAGEDVRVYRRGKGYVIIWNTGSEELWFDFLSLDFLFVKEDKDVCVLWVDEGMYCGGRRTCGIFHSPLDARREAEKLAKSYGASKYGEDRWIGDHISIDIVKERVE